MRWRFPDASEENERRLVLARIDDFWAAVTERAGELATFRERGWSGESWLAEQLARVEPGLGWELGPDQDGQWLVLTPAARRHLTPLVGQLLARAPKLPGWRFVGHRPPLPLAGAAAIVEAGAARSLEGWRCEVAPGAHHLLEVRCGVPDSKGPSDAASQRAALLATEALLGGELHDRWTGAVRAVDPSELTDAHPLEVLAERFVFERQRLLATLPRAPLRRDQGSWTMHRFNPRRRPDYHGRRDLLVGSSMMPALWRCAHGGITFASERFSRVGETFGYLKFDTDEGFGDHGFEDRSEVEDALDDALAEARLGCVIGGGSGLRYGYVDLALLDVAAGFEVIGRVMREGAAPRRSWLLFFDDDLTDEWLGVWPQT
ncbi:MAG: hypothetical protein EOO75_01540, partial [Myxococcales bacterium]